MSATEPGRINPYKRAMRDWKFSVTAEVESTSERAVLCLIAFHTDRLSGASWPGRDYLAEVCRMSKRQVSRTISALIKAGHIQKHIRGRQAIYTLRPYQADLFPLALATNSRDKKIGDRESPIGDRESPIGDRESPIGDRESPIGDRESPIGDRESTNRGLRVSKIINKDHINDHTHDHSAQVRELKSLLKP